MRGALVATALLSLHGQNIGIDSHIDTMQRMLIEGADLTQRSSGGHVDFPRLRDGGVNAPFFALWVPTYYKRSEAVRRTLDLRDAFEPMLSAHPDQIALALNALTLSALHGRARSPRFSPSKAATRSTSGHRSRRHQQRLRRYLGAPTRLDFRRRGWERQRSDST